MAADLSIHDGMKYSGDVVEFASRTRTYSPSNRYIVFTARQGSEEFRYFVHLTSGLSADYMREVATKFEEFSALLRTEADNLPTNDEEE